MIEHNFIFMKTGKSNLFSSLANGKTLILGVMNHESIPHCAVPIDAEVGSGEWSGVTERVCIDMIERGGFETVIFYSYDSFHIVESDVKNAMWLIQEHAPSVRRCAFMFNDF